MFATDEPDPLENAEYSRLMQYHLEHRDMRAPRLLLRLMEHNPNSPMEALAFIRKNAESKNLVLNNRARALLMDILQEPKQNAPSPVNQIVVKKIMPEHNRVVMWSRATMVSGLLAAGLSEGGRMMQHFADECYLPRLQHVIPDEGALTTPMSSKEYDDYLKENLEEYARFKALGNMAQQALAGTLLACAFCLGMSLRKSREMDRKLEQIHQEIRDQIPDDEIELVFDLEMRALEAKITAYEHYERGVKFRAAGGHKLG